MFLGSNHGTDKRFFSSPKHPDQLWEPPTLLCKGIGVLSWDESSQNIKLTTDVHVLEIFSFINVLAP
jgi:hypothetical protein